jgi:uncharacterized protein (TIGR03643 family)
MVDEKLISDNGLPTGIKNYVSDLPEIIEEDKDRIIQMAWEDRTPFEAIEFQFGLKEKDVIEFMRKNSLPSSFKMWRKRMKSRKTKHSFLREKSIDRFKCSRQRNSGNKIAKR